MCSNVADWFVWVFNADEFTGKGAYYSVRYFITDKLKNAEYSYC